MSQVTHGICSGEGWKPVVYLHLCPPPSVRNDTRDLVSGGRGRVSHTLLPTRLPHTTPSAFAHRTPNCIFTSLWD